jgi:hypothetical protein
VEDGKEKPSKKLENAVPSKNKIGNASSEKETPGFS